MRFELCRCGRNSHCGDRRIRNQDQDLIKKRHTWARKTVQAVHLNESPLLVCLIGEPRVERFSNDT